MSPLTILPKRVIFTGGSGLVGHQVLTTLLRTTPHKFLNLDIASPPKPFPNSQIHTLKTDLTNSGQVFHSFTSPFTITQPFPKQTSPPPHIPDAIVHFAAFPRPLIVPEDELFHTNTQSAFNVISTACKLGIKKVILASSVTVYGPTYADGDIPFPSFPVDEECDINPMDGYALSKLCMERVGRGFARRFEGVDIYSLRLGAVILPWEWKGMFEGYVNEPEKWKSHGWSYIDVRDLAQIVSLSISTSNLGFQIFNATNDEITNFEDTEPFLRRLCPETKFTREMGEREAPMSNHKVKAMLGFKEEFGWRGIWEQDKKSE